MFIRQYFLKENDRRTAYWALVESYRTASGPRQRVVAWWGKIGEAGRLGVQPPGRQMRFEFDDEASVTQPRWVEVNTAGVRVENLRQFGGPWKTLAQLCERAGLDNEPRRVLSEPSDIRSMDVVLPTRSGIDIRTRCISKPTDHQKILLEKLRLRLPSKIIQRKI